MKKFFCFISLIFLLPNLGAQTFPFSDDAVVSLITCSPGKEVYASFGHTAVRVQDAANDIDIVFNYGIFDFSTKNFYFKFIKGETDYKLAAYDFKYFLMEYKERNSMVWEQVLNLTAAEKKKFLQALIKNYEPQNRVYRYNFIYDNCSTRPRDRIIEAIEGQLQYSRTDNILTFRQWINQYVGRDYWLMLGIDMIFGDDSDEKASRYESMFLPEVLMHEFQAAAVWPCSETGRRPLVSAYNVLSEKEPGAGKELFSLFRPLSVFTILLLISILLYFTGTRYHYALKTFDTVLFAAAGLIGCVVFFLMFVSVHPMVKHNASILWLNPLFLFAAVSQWFKPLRFATFCLQSLNAALLASVLISFALLSHYFNLAFIPLILTLLLRTLSYLRIRIKRGVKVGNRKLRIPERR